MTTQIQTPYFVIDEPILQRYYDMLTDSLTQNWPNYLIGYSFKTNSLPWLVSFVKRNGAFAEVVSEDGETATGQGDGFSLKLLNPPG